MSSQPAILIVDHEGAICAACRRVLADEGFRVECSTDPVAGLRMAASRPYAAVLLDLRMPELDGPTFLVRLRATKPGLPVVIITGCPSIESASECVRQGARDFLPKPFTPGQIRDAVRRALAGRCEEGPRRQSG